MHEIVTIQLGTQSNYVGTHFWNAQESYFTYPPNPPSLVDHNVHFRAGITRNGTETFTPRALLYDFKENFGALGPSGGLYDDGETDERRDGGIWSSGPITTIRQPAILESTYHGALAANAGLAKPLTTSSIRFFTDYLHPFYHPRSLRPLSVLSLSQSTLPPPVPSSAASSQNLSPSSFQKWQAGEELFETLNKDNELLDEDLRFWIEECDALQGVQVVVDAESSWGGFSKGWIDGIRDEIGSKGSIWIWAVGGWDETGGPEAKEKRRATRLLNSAYSLFNLSPQASLYLPVSAVPISTPSYLSLNQTSPWHTSALQVAALETTTLPSRLRTTTEGRRGLLRDLEEAVNRGGEKKVIGLSLSMNGVSSGETNGSRPNGAGEPDELGELEMNLFPSFSSRTDVSTRNHVFGRVDVRRGFNDPAEGGDEEENSRTRYDGPIVEKYDTPHALPLLETYPRIFSTSRPSQPSLGVHTALQSTSGIAVSIKQLEESVRRLVSVEERETVCNGLKGIADEYVEGWDSGSDVGDDEDW